MSRSNHYSEEIKYLKRILSVLDGISYLMAFYELFIEKSITVGLFITLISIGLNVLIAYCDNEEKILHFAEKFRWEGKGEESAQYFAILSIIYILTEIICFGMANSMHEYMGLFWGVFVIFPVIYSILSMLLKLIFNAPSDTYAGIQLILAIAPIAIGFIMIVFGSPKLIEKIAAIVVFPILSLPVGGVAFLASDIIEKQ